MLIPIVTERYLAFHHYRWCPAGLKKFRFDEETIQELLAKEWWNGDAEEIEKVKEMEFRVGEYVDSNFKEKMMLDRWGHKLTKDILDQL